MKPRPGKEPLLTEKQGNQIIAMVTSKPPPGYERWTIRLITSETMKRKIVLSIGKDTIRSLLHKHDLK
ncbi:MAG: hypothetical protein ABUK01_19505, partial [Leptospirales bacterium]